MRKSTFRALAALVISGAVPIATAAPGNGRGMIGRAVGSPGPPSSLPGMRMGPNGAGPGRRLGPPGIPGNMAPPSNPGLHRHVGPAGSKFGRKSIPAPSKPGRGVGPVSR